MNKTILYIEDNGINAEIVDEILQDKGYTVIIAEDGAEGISIAEQHQPDLIICDFHLLGMNGPEIVRSIRDKEMIKNTPIIMLTADIYNRSDSMKAGVDAYLNKPIRRNQLLSAIKELL
jgi:CheY-like chemotaxis protein